MPLTVSQLMRATSVRTRRHGLLHLRRLTLGDVKWLVTLDQPSLTDHDYVAKVIHHQIEGHSLTVADTQAWSDRVLLRVASAWVKGEQGIVAHLPTGNLSFGALRSAVSTYQAHYWEQTSELVRGIVDQNAVALRSALAGITQQVNVAEVLGVAMRPLIDQMAEQSKALAGVRSAMMLDIATSAITTSKALEGIQGTLQRVAASLRPLTSAGGLFRLLPDLSGMVRQWEEALEAGKPFEASGYGFTIHLWDVSFVTSFTHVHPRVRHAAMTNSLAAYTRSADFETALKHAMQRSLVLRRRWPVVARALSAHRRRDYLLSIPALLVQVEGTIADALILKDIAVPKGGKLYRQEHGRLKLDKHGKPQELRGAGQLIQHSGFQQHAVLHRIVALMTTQLVDDRNAILHGRRTSYGVAQLSIQSLLLLLILATEIAAFEAGETPRAT